MRCLSQLVQSIWPLEAVPSVPDAALLDASAAGGAAAASSGALLSRLPSPAIISELSTSRSASANKSVLPVLPPSGLPSPLPARLSRLALPALSPVSAAPSSLSPLPSAAAPGAAWPTSSASAPALMERVLPAQAASASQTLETLIRVMRRAPKGGGHSAGQQAGARLQSCPKRAPQTAASVGVQPPRPGLHDAQQWSHLKK